MYLTKNDTGINRTILLMRHNTGRGAQTPVVSLSLVEDHYERSMSCLIAFRVYQNDDGSDQDSVRIKPLGDVHFEKEFFSDLSEFLIGNFEVIDDYYFNRIKKPECFKRLKHLSTLRGEIK